MNAVPAYSPTVNIAFDGNSESHDIQPWATRAEFSLLHVLKPILYDAAAKQDPFELWQMEKSGMQQRVHAKTA